MTHYFNINEELIKKCFFFKKNNKLKYFFLKTEKVIVIFLENITQCEYFI